MERSEVDIEAQRKLSTISLREKQASSQQLNSAVAAPIIQPEIFNALETRFGENGLVRLREEFDSGHEFAFWKGVVPEDIIAKCCEEADRLKVLKILTHSLTEILLIVEAGPAELCFFMLNSPI